MIEVAYHTRQHYVSLHEEEFVLALLWRPYVLRCNVALIKENVAARITAPKNWIAV